LTSFQPRLLVAVGHRMSSFQDWQAVSVPASGDRWAGRDRASPTGRLPARTELPQHQSPIGEDHQQRIRSAVLYATTSK